MLTMLQHTLFAAAFLQTGAFGTIACASTPAARTPLPRNA